MRVQPFDPSMDDLATIQAALDELNAGDEGLPLAEAIAEILNTVREGRVR